MGTLHSWRKAYGALKDSTKVGLAKVNSDYKELDVAIVKATNHAESPPKEHYVRRIFAAVSVAKPRADVAYCIYALGRRLAKTHNWTVALKSLIVIHRILREGDASFRDELLSYSHKGHVLQMSNFKDDSSPLAWDCSAWVRTYALFLEERLECFRVLKYEIEADRSMNCSPGSSKAPRRTSELGSNKLMEQLPALQQLMYRLTGCRPEGGAFDNYLVQFALTLVLKESFKIYCAINDGIINLVDMFFDMSRHDAVKALNIYKRSGQQAESLADFYEYCKGLDLARHFQFPTLRQPPPSFLATMEEYIREATALSSTPNNRLEYEEMPALEYKPEEVAEPTVEASIAEATETEEPPAPSAEAESQLESNSDTADFLGLSEVNPDAIALEESNALALAIIIDGDASKSSANHGLVGSIGDDVSGWELALVTTHSSNRSHLDESKLAGGFDKLLLDSLYEYAEARKEQNGGYGAGMGAETNGPLDPFAMSNNFAPPRSVQMAMLSHQQLMQRQQHMMSTTTMPHYIQPQMGGSTPFGDPYVGFTQNAHYGSIHYGNPNLI